MRDEQFLVLVGQRPFGRWGQHQSRRDAVASHAGFAVLRGYVPREVDRTGFADAVIAARQVAGQPSDRRDVDDRAAAVGRHPGDCLLRNDHHAANHHMEHFVEIIQVGVQQVGVPFGIGIPGVVDDHVDPAEIFQRMRRQVARTFQFRRIEIDGDGVSSGVVQGLAGLFSSFQVVVGHDDRGPFGA